MASGEVLGFALSIWDELAAGTPGYAAPVGVVSHPDAIHRTAGYVTRMSGGVGGGRPRDPHTHQAKAVVMLMSVRNR